MNGWTGQGVFVNTRARTTVRGMPPGQRVVRIFVENDSITALYAYVDSLFIPPEYG